MALLQLHKDGGSSLATNLPESRPLRFVASMPFPQFAATVGSSFSLFIGLGPHIASFGETCKLIPVVYDGRLNLKAIWTGPSGTRLERDLSTQENRWVKEGDRDCKLLVHNETGSLRGKRSAVRIGPGVSLSKSSPLLGASNPSAFANVDFRMVPIHPEPRVPFPSPARPISRFRWPYRRVPSKSLCPTKYARVYGVHMVCHP
jgi:hypothetical protein